MKRVVVTACIVAALVSCWWSNASAWGAQGHRVVAQIAAAHLTRVARQNVEWLIAPQTLADVSSWADRYLEGNYQTFYWHFLNIPPDATSYNRDRDCPRQPTVAAGSGPDKWRDCAVDRILYNRERLADTRLDRADRAIALKFLVHFVGDLHQPFHALGVERGGNGIPVRMFGSENCSTNGTEFSQCNLHGAWDTGLMTHRHLNDGQLLSALDAAIKRNKWDTRAIGTPAEWAMQSHGFGKAALVAPHANIDEPYYRAALPVIDERLALAGLRLAALINQSLVESH